jgi:hypothetical protein
VPGATFEVIKDGIVEKRAFAARAAAPSAESAPGEPALDAPHGAAVTAAPASAQTPPATEAPSPSDALAKAASALAHAAHKLERAAAENEALRKTVAALAPDIEALRRRVAALEAQPLPAKAALRAVPKSADSSSEPSGVDEAIKRLAALPAQERALALTKLSLANPVHPRF